MEHGRRLSTEERNRIVEEYKSGARAAHLARSHGVSRWTIYRLIDRYDRTGSVEVHFARSGRRSKITDEQREAIREALTKDPKADLSTLMKRLNITCTLRGLYYALEKMGFPRSGKRPEPKEERIGPGLRPKPITGGTENPVWKGWGEFWRKEE